MLQRPSLQPPFLLALYRHKYYFSLRNINVLTIFIHTQKECFLKLKVLSNVIKAGKEGAA